MFEISMPRYFFHVYHGRVQMDRIGEELPDKQSAWKEATATAGRILQDIDGKLLLSDGPWRMEVTDEFGSPAFRTANKWQVNGVRQGAGPIASKRAESERARRSVLLCRPMGCSATRKLTRLSLSATGSFCFPPSLKLAGGPLDIRLVFLR